MAKAALTKKLQNKTLQKTLTGINGLDEITGGGLPKARPTLICGEAGSGKTLFSIEFIVRGATQFNEPGVFVAFEEKSEELAMNVASLGHDLDKLINTKKIRIDHAVPTLVRKVPVPIRKIISDLSNEEKVLVGLNIVPLKK